MGNANRGTNKESLCAHSGLDQAELESLIEKIGEMIGAEFELAHIKPGHKIS